MGAFFGRIFSYFSGSKENEQPAEEGPKVYSWDLRKNVDPNEYMLQNRKGETIIKSPGSINGNQYTIQFLENCSVYIFDNMAVINIDDCKNCKFFVGPSKGSVFIRDCSDCNLAVVCQQFRTRDCKRITTFLSCSTQPIIEASTQMKFACLSCNYKELADQVKKANLTIFNSNWGNVHDFSRIPGEVNYSILNSTFKLEDYVQYPEASVKNERQLTYDPKFSFFPFTLGTEMKRTKDSCLVILFQNATNSDAVESHARDLIRKVTETYSDISLINSKCFKISDISSEQVFLSKDYNKYLNEGPVIGLEFNGSDSINKCQNICRSINTPMYVSTSSDHVQRQLDNFYNLADMNMSA